MKLNKKKGFTIVELVIVIAVIAILAAVLIPNISKLVKKANASADESLVRNLNTALAMDTEKHATMSDALKAALDNGGYDVAKIVTKDKDNKILWDSVNDCFVYLKKGDEKPTYIPKTSGKYTEAKDYQLFEIVTEKPTSFADYTTYSIYAAWTAAETDTVEDLKVGFDAGNNKFASVKFATDATVSVIINTNGGELSINAKDATVTHYGKATFVNIEEVATSSYHENGTVNEIKLKAGRVVVEGKAEVGSVLVTASDITTINGKKNVSVEVKSTATLGAVGATESQVLGKLEAAVTGNTDVITNQVADSKGFAGGFGTEKAPYLVETAEQFALINTLDFSNSSYYFKQIADISISAPVKQFAGTYDGSNYKLSYIYSFGNSGYIFYETTGFSEFKNIIVEMGSIGVTLLDFADWGTAYGATFENITFSSTASLTNVNNNNFGFVIANALYTKGEAEPVYNFINITNNVNLQNSGTCTGVIIGSGPCCEAKTTINFTNCINNGKIIGDRVGFLYGNSYYLITDKEAPLEKSGSVINVSECKNNSTLLSVNENGKKNAGFALDLSEINDKYEAEVCGSKGAFITSNYFSTNTITINQNQTSFSITTTDKSVSYKLVFKVQSTFKTLDGEAWDDDDVKAMNDKDQWHTVADVSNGLRYLISLPITDGAADNKLSSTFKAYDKKTAAQNGFDTENLEYNSENYAIVVKDNVTYLIFNTTEDCYINCGVSVLVYAYAGEDLQGMKTIVK